MDRQILYPAEIPLVEDGLNAQRNAMVGVGHLASAAFGANTVAASGFACSPADGLAVTIAPGALLAPGVVDASAYGTLTAVSSALVRQFISRDPVILTVPSAGAAYVVYVTPQTVDTDDTVLPFYNAADPSVTYAGQNNSGLAAPTVRRDEAVLAVGSSAPSGAYPLWQIVVPAGATTLTADMLSIASGAPFYPSLAAVASRIIAPFNAQLAAAMGGYPLNAVVADTTTPNTFWVSTSDANVSTPGADGATWQSLFSGLATQAWSNGRFLQLASTALQTVTGPVVFSGETAVPNPTDVPGQSTGNHAASTFWVDENYAKLNGSNTLNGAQIINGNTTVNNGDIIVATGGYAFAAHGGDGSLFQLFKRPNATDTSGKLSLYDGANWYETGFWPTGDITTTKGDVAFVSQLPFSDTTQKIQAFAAEYDGSSYFIPFPTAFKAGTTPIVVALPNKEPGGNHYDRVLSINNTGLNTNAPNITNEGFSFSQSYLAQYPEESGLVSVIQVVAVGVFA
ncbi:hypothetical protein [Acetobacter orientalis]|uniref:hypothetical protein n=1 Tax=Acetobacter orientalis TaxID=146474 RepID=UPI0015D95AAB|nr:hypothetical protein [Acetobacter orientalis]